MNSQAEQEHRLPWVSFVVSIVVIVAFALAFQYLPIEPQIERLHSAIVALGPAGPLLFVLILMLAVIIPPVPERPLILSAGLLFGIFNGSILVILGISLGASVSFWIGQRYVSKLLQNRSTFQRLLNGSKVLGDWHTIFLIRMFAGFTLDWYSYYLGLLRIRWSVFLTATALGITPGVILEVTAGSFLTKNPWMTVGISLVIATIALIIQKHSASIKSISQVQKSISNPESAPVDRSTSDGPPGNI